MFAIGLTGGIGSGKSMVARQFADFGAGIVDADEISQGLTAPGGAAMPAIVEQFGAAVQRPDGGLNRAAMRSLVFGDPSERARLEAILHPLIRASSQQLAAALAERHAYVMLVIPLLVESGHWHDRLARVLVVDCDEAVQEARVIARNGLSREAVRAIIASQASRAERCAVADDVIDNSQDHAQPGIAERLSERIAALHQRYLELAGAA